MQCEETGSKFCRRPDHPILEFNPTTSSWSYWLWDNEDDKFLVNRYQFGACLDKSRIYITGGIQITDVGVCTYPGINPVVVLCTTTKTVIQKIHLGDWGLKLAHHSFTMRPSHITSSVKEFLIFGGSLPEPSKEPVADKLQKSNNIYWITINNGIANMKTQEVPQDLRDKIGVCGATSHWFDNNHVVITGENNHESKL